jgi:hypothetical protein
MTNAPSTSCSKTDGYRSSERKKTVGKNTAGTAQCVHVLQNNSSHIYFHHWLEQKDQMSPLKLSLIREWKEERYSGKTGSLIPQLVSCIPQKIRLKIKPTPQ